MSVPEGSLGPQTSASEVPLLGGSPRAERTKGNKEVSFGMAISGWLVAAGLACAYASGYLYNSGASAATAAAPPQALMEVVGSDGGLNCRWVLLALIRAAGYGQIMLVLSSAAIPFLLDYKKELGAINKPLLKAMFLVYSGYILVINFLFGLLSAFAAESILQVGFLPSVITGFIFLYWFARLLIELFVFDLSFLDRPHEIVGRRGIEILFTVLPLIYGLAFMHNMGKLSLNYNVPDIGPFGRMLVIIIAVFMIMKICVVSMPQSEGPKLTRFQTFIFFFVWPGMQPARLLTRKAGLDWWRDAGWGMAFIVLGFLWSVGIRFALDAGLSQDMAGLLALPGISMMGHVGALRVLRGGLRFAGYDVEQLFVDPFLATSISEFWGKRWNLAFADMNRFVFVAAIRTALMEDLGMSKAVAGQAGVFVAFVASAILHELGITVPVLAGYGGPSLYFLIQGFFVVVEKRPAVATWREKNPTLARFLVWMGLAAPFPICFVVPFRTQVALPLTIFVADLPMTFLGLLK